MISKLFKEAIEGEKETVVIWKKGNIFEKGHWRIFQIRTGNGGGALLVLILYLIFYVFVGSLILMLLPIIIALIGLQMVRIKRYITGILSFIGLLYFYIDIKNQWVSSLLFYGWTNEEGEFTNGIFGESIIPLFTIVNILGVIIGLWFIIDRLLIHQFARVKPSK